MPRRGLLAAVVAVLASSSCGVEVTSSDHVVELSSPPASEITPPTTTVVETSITPPTTTVVETSISQSTDPTLPTTSLDPVVVPLGSTTQPSSSALVLDVLAGLVVEREHGQGYDRSLFEHWITVGGCSTREQVLIRDSLSPAQVDPFGCRVVAGDWLSPYDGAVWSDPADVDIDHVVALKEAWDSGAWAWSSDRRRAFANDLSDHRTLRVVTDDVNQAKGDRDPSNWMPPLESDWCSYLSDWVAIKARWGLSMDESEAGRIAKLVRSHCPDMRLAP